MLRRLFFDHPASLGETYAEHRRAAARFGTSMIAAGAACLVHSVVPHLFRTTASETIARLNAQVVARRQGAPATATAAEIARRY